MLNQVVLIGRITNTHQEEGSASLIMAIPRSYKNTKGEYETDSIKVKLFGNIASSTMEYCKQGDLIGVKGSLETGKRGNTFVKAEKITFLSSKDKSYLFLSSGSQEAKALDCNSRIVGSTPTRLSMLV